MRGKLIVIEGTDCSGKQTQSEKVLERLKQDGVLIERISFPIYGTPTGDIIGGPYLGKKNICEGWFKEGAANVNPKVASLFYAADRLYNINKITDLLDKGIHVLADRYTISNMAHQGGKLSESSERLKFIKWIDDLEYGLLELPKPDLAYILYLPYKYGLELKQNREETLDQHESSKKHLEGAENTYLELADTYNYKVINCVSNEEIRSVDDINDELYAMIKKDLVI